MMTARIVRLLLVLALGLAGPPAAHAQTGKVWHIGLIHVGLDHEPPSLPTLREELRALGYDEGRNLRFDWRNQPDEATAHRTAMEFVRDRVDLIVAFEDQSVRAAKAATSAIPIVFLHVYDPVAAGYVENKRHPGGNITGFISFLDVIPKRLELFREIVPQLKRVLVLTDPEDPVGPRLLAEVKHAAIPLNLEVVERAAPDESALEQVFAALKPYEVDGVLIAAQTIQANHPMRVVQLADRAHLPLVMHRREWVEAGALFSYGIDLAPTGRIAARYIDKILKGTKPGDLAVEELPEVKLTINVRKAREFDLTIPWLILTRADEMIE